LPVVWLNSRYDSALFWPQMLTKKQGIPNTENNVLVHTQESVPYSFPPKTSEQCDAIVVGALAIDLTCSLNTSTRSPARTSYPGKIESSIGGVGHNIALAALYTGETSGVNVRLVSQVGSDDATVIQRVKQEGLDVAGILENSQMRTARYVSMNDGSGELVIACADMDVIRDIDEQHIKKEIRRAKPKVVFFDGNIGDEQKAAVVGVAREVGAFIGFEPTSVPKAGGLATLNLQTYPNHLIDFATPNVLELQEMFESFHEAGRFDIENWFPVIDALGVNQDLRQQIENMAKAKPELADIISSGIAQRALHLLPYIPSLLVKRGDRGVLTFQLLSDLDQTRRAGLKKATEGSQVSSVLVRRDGGKLGVLVQHFRAKQVNPSEIVSVSGAGDTFCGALLAELVKDPTCLADSGSRKVALMDRAQRAAAISICNLEAVPSELARLTDSPVGHDL
jgi:pseudouridine-5'-phosphate glycosidase/pseudouridine kinase